MIDPYGLDGGQKTQGLDPGQPTPAQQPNQQDPQDMLKRFMMMRQMQGGGQPGQLPMGGQSMAGGIGQGMAGGMQNILQAMQMKKLMNMGNPQSGSQPDLSAMSSPGTGA